jgi:hypothetical protein
MPPGALLRDSPEAHTALETGLFRVFIFQKQTLKKISQIMASINKLEMMKSPALSELFEVKKGFLGFGSKVTYKPTGSSVTVDVLEYSLADGEMLERVLRMGKEQMVEKLKSANLSTHGMGNARLEVLKADDGTCVVMQLFRFVDFGFQSASEVIALDGADAEAIGKIY